MIIDERRATLVFVVDEEFIVSLAVKKKKTTITKIKKIVEPKLKE